MLKLRPAITVASRAALALLLAFAAWMLVTWEQDPFREGWLSDPLPIEATHLPSGLIELGQLGTVRVKIRASQDAWGQVRAADFKASVDLTRLKAGIQTADVKVETSGQYQLVDWQPRQMTLRLEPRAARVVPVGLEVSGGLAEGYVLLGQSVTPDQLEVSGPQNLVQQVAQVAVSTTLNGVRGDVTEDLTPHILDKDGQTVSGIQANPAKLRVVLNVDRTVRVKTVPIQVPVNGQPASGYTLSSLVVSPPTVNIVGAPSVLNKIDYVEVAPLNLSGATTTLARTSFLADGNGYSPTIKTEVKVTAVIIPLRSTEVLPVDLTVRGVGPGLEAKVSPLTAQLTVDGIVPELLRLRPGDLSAVVDVTGLSAGLHTLPIRVTSPASVHVGDTRPNQVTVTLAPVASATPSPQASVSGAASGSASPSAQRTPAQ